MSAGNGKVHCSYEYGALKEAVVGISPYQDFVIPRWYPGLDFMGQLFKELSQKYGGQPLYKVPGQCEFAQAIEAELDQFAGVLSQRGVNVHRPTQLVEPEKTYLTADAEGAQLYPRDDMLVVGDQIIELSTRMHFRRREVFGVRPVVQPIAQDNGVPWTAMPIAALPLPPPNPIGSEDDDTTSAFLEGGDVLLNGEHVYVGNGHSTQGPGLASNSVGKEWLQHQLGSTYQVHEVPIVRKALHLDAVMMLLGKKLGIRCKALFADPNQPMPPGLEDHHWIEVSEEEAHLHLACNLCVIDEQHIVLPKRQTSIGDQLRSYSDIESIYVDYENVVQIGGGLRCSHHPILRVDP